MKPEDEIFSELIQLCRSPGFAHALSCICIRDNWISYGDEISGKDISSIKDKDRLIRTEISALVAGLVGGSRVFEDIAFEVVLEYIEKAEMLLEKIHNSMIECAISETNGEFPSLNMGEAIREAAFYATESAYPFQYVDFAIDRYGRDSEWLSRNLGFTIADACKIFQSVSHFQDEKTNEYLRFLRRRKIENPSFLSVFELDISEIESRSGLSSEIVQAFVDAFSCNSSVEDINYRSVTDFNLTSVRPILRHGNRYFLFQNASLAEAIYEAPSHWMFQDSAYRSIAAKNKGKFTEGITFRYLKRVFGDKHVYRNLDLYSGASKIGEIDVYVSFGEVGIILQCKSQKLTFASRGGSIVNIEKDFRLAIQSAYDQCIECFQGFQRDKFAIKSAEGTVLSFPSPSRIFPVTVICEHYPSLGAQVREFLERQSVSKLENPLCIDVFTLDVLTDLVSSPIRFLSYLERRSLYFDKIMSTNELGVLGYFLRSNLWLEDEDIICIDDGCSSDIDAAMMVRRMGLPGKRTPEGILTRFRGSFVGRVIDEVDRNPNAFCVELGLSLLEFGDEGVSDFEGLISIMSQKGRGDFTISLEHRSSGITVHCNNDRLLNAKHTLSEHMLRRKYYNRADRWLGLLVDPVTRLVRFGAYVKKPHVFDYRLESAISKSASPVMIADVLRDKSIRKIGRNEKCSCGSNLKFKNCCGKK